MNKHLNNWLDQVEGNPIDTSNNNILKEMARQLGSKGGKQSVKVRFKGKTKQEISELMRSVRLTKSERKEVDIMVNESLESLRRESLK